MIRKAVASFVAVGAFSLVFAATSPGADANTSAAHHAPKVFINPVATHLQRIDITFGEDPTYRWVTTVSYKLIGCAPGENVYWSTGRDYQDGHELFGVFGGLGQGEEVCAADGTSTYGDLWYGDPKCLHPGWMKASAQPYDEDTGVLLASSTRRVWIPRH